MISLLGSLNALRQAKPPEPRVLTVAGRTLPLSFKRKAKCRRMVLRLTPDGQGIVMTLPNATTLSQALRFAETSIPWIEGALAKRPTTIAFQNDSKILFQGKPCAIKATGGRRGFVTYSSEDASICVPGELAHVPRRLTDWLKAQAKVKLHDVSQNYATAMQTKFRKLTVRDQKSRWGSCSATGDLSYSWRLILAPPEVLDYVAAHEVAHLKEMNHGPRFWRLVITHCKKAKEARSWLRDHGRELHRYG
jgi:predicted metal-dependent hydrolase